MSYLCYTITLLVLTNWLDKMTFVGIPEKEYSSETKEYHLSFIPI